MKQSIIFLDVDGTLTSTKTGKVPLSAKQAIHQAHQNGHLIYLCTGRSLPELQGLLSDDIDGIIGAAGGFTIHQNKLIDSKTLSKAQVLDILNVFNASGVYYYLESNQGIYATKKYINYMNNSIHDFASLIQPISNTNYEHINKISFISPYDDLKTLNQKLNDQYQLIQSSYEVDNAYAGEISLKGITKATAIQSLLKHLNIESITTYGFGDSMNDIEMLQVVDVAVAMGNAIHGLSQYADFITKDVDDDGLAYAFKYYQLI